MSAHTDRPAALPGAAMLPPAQPAPTRQVPRPDAKGRFATINEFIDTTMRELTPAARAVWLILWRDTKPNGLARTGQADLARRAGVSDRAVRTALRELEEAGVTKLVKPGRIGSGVAIYKVRGMNPDARTDRKPRSGCRRKRRSGTKGSMLPPSQNGTTSGGPLTRPPRSEP